MHTDPRKLSSDAGSPKSSTRAAPSRCSPIITAQLEKAAPGSHAGEEPAAVSCLVPKPMAADGESDVLHIMETVGPVICGGHRHWSLILAARTKGFVPSCALELVQLGQSYSLARYVDRYLQHEIFDMKSIGTVATRSEELLTFVRWFVAFNGHGDIAGWQKRHTQLYLENLQRDGRNAKRPIKRSLMILRHFAGWVHGMHRTLFPRGEKPTQDVVVFDFGTPKTAQNAPAAGR